MEGTNAEQRERTERRARQRREREAMVREGEVAAGGWTIQEVIRDPTSAVTVARNRDSRKERGVELPATRYPLPAGLPTASPTCTWEMVLFYRG